MFDALLIYNKHIILKLIRFLNVPVWMVSREIFVNSGLNRTICFLSVLKLTVLNSFSTQTGDWLKKESLLMDRFLLTGLAQQFLMAKQLFLVAGLTTDRYGEYFAQNTFE